MAKREDARSTKSKMTVMVFQLEGSDETIQEGLKRVSDAIHGMVKQQPRLLLKTSDTSNSGSTETDESPRPDREADSDAQPEEESQEGGDNAARVPKKEEREKPLQIVPTIDFKKASASLESFSAEKKAGEGAQRRLLESVMWLRDHADVKEFSADHVYTCFKYMKWTNIPDRPRKFIRNLKSQKGYFDSGTKTGHYTLNHIGEKEVEAPEAAS